MLVLKTFITNVLEYKAVLSLKFKCVCMNLCSRDYSNGIVIMVINSSISYGAWFLDSRTLTCFIWVLNKGI